jgi:hypothetical protein
MHLTSFRRTCFYFQEGTNCTQADHSTKDIIAPRFGIVNRFSPIFSRRRMYKKYTTQYVQKKFKRPLDNLTIIGYNGGCKGALGTAGNS